MASFLMSTFLLIFLVLVKNVVGVLDPKHLCHKVMTGRFHDIYIRSITYYGPKRLWLFEDERKYTVNRTTEMGPESTTLPVANFTAWNAEEMAFVNKPYFFSLAKKAMPTPKSIYLLGYANPDRFYGMKYVRNIFTRECLLAVLIGEHEESIWDIWWNVLGKPNLKWQSEGGRVHPDFVLITDQLNDHPEGYVMHQDIYSNTRNYILYDLLVDRSFSVGKDFLSVKLHIHRLNAPAEERVSAHYFYLEKNEQPGQVLLVHRSNFKAKQLAEAQSEAEMEEERRRQLLHPDSHPVGFKNGENTFLFDNLLGCVYIVHRLPSSLEALYKKYEGNPEASELTFNRKNVPYEDFFRCDVEYFKMKGIENVFDPDRCQTTIHTKPKVGPMPVDYRKDTGLVALVLGLTATGTLLLLLTLLLVNCCCREVLFPAEQKIPTSSSSF